MKYPNALACAGVVLLCQRACVVRGAGLGIDLLFALVGQVVLAQLVLGLR